MSTGPTFPALAFGPYHGVNAESGEKNFEYFPDAEEFSTLYRSDKIERRVGLIVNSSDGRCWQVLSASAGEVMGSWPGRLLRSMFGMTRRKIHYEFLELPPMSLAQTKDKVVEVIMQRPYDWWDDEAIAGEDGEPRDAEEMIEDFIARVRNAAALSDVFYVVDNPHEYDDEPPRHPG